MVIDHSCVALRGLRALKCPRSLTIWKRVMFRVSRLVELEAAEYGYVIAYITNPVLD